MLAVRLVEEVSKVSRKTKSRKTKSRNHCFPQEVAMVVLGAAVLEAVLVLEAFLVLGAEALEVPQPAVQGR